MPFTISLAPAAQMDIEEAILYYTSISETLSKRFLTYVLNRLDHLSITPFSGSIRYENIRCCVVKKFPFIIHYEVFETERRITVYRVLHASQKPLGNS